MRLPPYLDGPRFDRARQIDWDEAERRRRRMRWHDGGQPGGFTFSSVAGYYVHHRAQGLALADTDPVGAWDDASGHGRALSQGTASKNPSYRTNVQNGLPVVRGDATDDHLVYASRILSPRATSFTACVVAKTSGAGAAALAAQDEGSPVLQLLLNNTTGGARLFVRDAAGQGAIAQGSTDLRGAFHLLTFVWDAASKSVAVRVDGATEATQSNASITLATLPDGIWGIGAQFDAAGVPLGFYYRDDLAEMVVYAAVLSASDLASVEGQLRATWGTP